MNLYYAPNDVTFWFLVYLLVAFLLVIRFNILYQEAKWRSEGIFFRPDVSFDFLRDGFIFSALVIGIAWLAPPVIDAKALGLLDEFEGTWHDVQSNWNRLYADLNYRDQTVSVGTFGQSFALGGPRLLTDEPVMAVQVEGVGRYWRATVYDEYNGVGWRSSQQDTASIGPDELPALPQYAATYPVTQTYTMFRQSATVLYAMAGISYLDRTAKVTFNELSREQIATIAALPRWPNSDGPIMEGITYIRSNAAVEEGESYQVISDISQATVSQLRSDGADYPAWIRNRYLQLPPLTDRTRELAQQITQDYETPFDKAQAVERYLRNNIKYNERIPAPPPGVDKVDYILFELGQAYCDYYATSMIVMLRSVGVPARMAAGFARGKYDAERDVFRVVNADAHSWVEVYFPTYGWVEFEPTAAQPTIIRPSNPDENSFSAGNIPNLDNLPDGSRAGYEEGLFGDNNIPIDDGFFAGGIFLSFNLPIFGTQINIPRSAVSSSFSLVGLLALLGLGGGALWWQRQQSLANKNIFNLYEGMLKFGRWMGALLQPWQTPYEHAAILQERLPTFKKEVTVITDDYVYHTFSPVDKLNPPPDRVAEESRTAWLRLRPTMAKLAIKQLIPPRLRFWQ
jgi:transglutaminase-like putative cysteine protease